MWRQHGRADHVSRVGDRARSHPRLPHLHRQPDGGGQAAGDRSRRGRSPIATRTSSTCLLLALAVVVGLLPGAGRSRLLAGLCGARRAVADLRRAADHPDRRRRHADGDLAAELLRRPVGRGDGLRARQQAADHRRRARRIVRLHPVGHHVQGDEPLVHQRAVRRVRAGAGGQRRRAKRRPSRARRRRTSPTS